MIVAVTIGMLGHPAPGSAQTVQPQQLREIEQYVKRLAAADSFSGVVLIAQHGMPLLQLAFGDANKGAAVPNRMDTRFILASMTKMFTGIAIGQLAQQGKLRFSDPVSKYVPEFRQPAADRITIHHLLTHTSGLGTIWKPAFHQGNHALYRNVRDFFPLFIDDPPQFEPGSKWSYSNAGYVLLGAIIEKVSGMTYREYVRANVFRPAAMTTALQDDIDLPIPDRAVPYTRANWTLRGYTGYSSSDLLGLVNMMPAGGGISSGPDLLRFANAIEQHVLLNRAYTDTVTSGKFVYRPGASYGYGFANETINGERIIFHDGGADGISTNFDIIPTRRITAIVLSNYDPPAGTRVSARIRQILLR
jgi:CubicO group peptidase (beta-lactamase class C family)